MANNIFQKQELNLLSPICMDINDSVVRPFDSFNKKNAPYVGDQLSPFYVESESAAGDAVFDINGAKWDINNGYLSKDGVKVPRSPSFTNTYKIINVPDNVKIYYEDSYLGLSIYQSQEADNEGFYCVYIKNATKSKLLFKSKSKRVYIKAYPTSGRSKLAIFIQSKEKHEALVYTNSLDEETVLSMKDLGLNSYQNIVVNIGYIPSSPGLYIGISYIIDEQERLGGVLAINYILDVTNKVLIDLRDVELTINSTDGIPIDTNIARNAFVMDASNYGFLNLAFIGNCISGETETPYIFEGCSKINSMSISNISATMNITHYATVKSTVASNDPVFNQKLHTHYEVHEEYYRRDCSYTLNEGNANYSTFASLENGIGFKESGGNLIGDTITRDVALTQPLFSNIFTSDKLKGYVTYNNGYPSAIISPKGNLITPWNSIREILFTLSQNTYFIDNKGVQKKIVTAPPKIMSIFENRYILINADAKYNAYDIVTNNWYNWTIGYNGTLIIGEKFTGQEVFDSDKLIKEYSRVALISAAVNPSYEIKGIPFISAQFAPILLSGIPDPCINIYTRPGDALTPTINIPSLDVLDVGLEFYSTIDSTIPIYRATLEDKGTTAFYDNELEGVAYPTGDIVLSPSLSSTFIQSYNNHDYIVEGTIGYPIIYSNNSPVFGYQILSFVENIKDIFVIQNSTYMLFNNKIMAVQYSGTELQGTTIVADYTGMDFIGNTSETAFFFSRLAKKIYTFTGDVVLRELRGANVIDKAYGSFFIPADNTIIVSCREGTKDYCYFFGTDSFLKIENEKVNRAFFSDNKVVLIGDNQINKYSYFKQEGMTKLPIVLQTGFFGLGREQQATIDSWYIRLFSDDNTEGTIQVKQNVLTTMGVQTETKVIRLNPLSFDRLTHSYLLRYQPRYQTGVGFQLEIQSDFSIYEIVASYKPGSTQLTAPSNQI